MKTELVYGKEQSQHTPKVGHHLLKVVMAKLGLNSAAVFPQCGRLTTIPASCAEIFFPPK